MLPQIVFLSAFLARIEPGAGQRFTRETLTGSDVILPCDDGAGNPKTLAWTVNINGNDRILLLVSSGVLNNRPPPVSYSGRLNLDGTKDLLLKDATISDEGEYRCKVSPYRLYADTLVTLKVYAQPKAPNITVYPEDVATGDVPVGTNVNLSCTAAGGRPAANIAWTITPNRLAHTEPSLSTTEGPDGLWDVTSSISFVMTGNRVTYGIRCDVTGPGPITNQSATLVLTSGPDTAQQLSTGAAAGVAVGVIAGVIIVVILVLFFVRYVTGPTFGDTRSFEGGFVNFRMSFSRHSREKSELSNKSDVQPTAPPTDASPNRRQQNHQEARWQSHRKPRPQPQDLPPGTDPSMFTSTPRDQTYENYIKWSPSFVLYSKESSVQV
ncbi:PREDICTED: nectin-4-like [Branchiostoma belcheri]|uniref:Nectin-4-like n=1 Tax=Branchiostoma belcheri TaxID=7741 RepID=A0A6P4Y139_BRABE|nr:PREDICTED: nectin-4-like [Branchiostoma belcheri]